MRQAEQLFSVFHAEEEVWDKLQPGLLADHPLPGSDGHPTAVFTL